MDGGSTTDGGFSGDGSGSGAPFHLAVGAHRGGTESMYIWSSIDGSLGLVPGSTGSFAAAYTLAGDVLAFDSSAGVVLRTNGNVVVPGSTNALGGLSPDGKSFSFSDYGRVYGGKAQFPWLLYVAPVATGTVTLLTPATGGPLGISRDDFGGAFRPDGARIALTQRAQDFKSTSILSVAPDGTNLAVLVAANGNEHLGAPAYSRDGTRMVFTSCPADGAGACASPVNAIEIANADGTNRKLVLGTATPKQAPLFTPSGDAVIFIEGNTYGTAKVVRLDLSTAVQSNLLDPLNTSAPPGDQNLGTRLMAVRVN